MLVVKRTESADPQDPELKPLRPNEGCHQLLIFEQRAVVCRAENVIDCDAVLGQRVKGASV